MLWEKHKGWGVLGAGNTLFPPWASVVWLVNLNVYVSFQMYISHLICHPFLKVLLAENLQNWEASICVVLNKGITDSMGTNLSKL